jgi:hypothetical protein
MKNARFKQFGLAIGLIVSLFASSISACACSHHAGKVEIETPSCHGHSETAKTGQPQKSDVNENAQSLVPQDECCCVAPPPKASAKSENLRIEKQALANLSLAPVETTSSRQTISVKSEFVRKIYLTDSFYNLTPGRAPPNL